MWECRSKYPVLVANIIVEFQDVIEKPSKQRNTKAKYIFLALAEWIEGQVSSPQHFSKEELPLGLCKNPGKS